ncbi:MAG: methylated-DNA--[Solobacterium sp.]|nr:methylated-DNA--[protein]-cysteine S-methyltransferase [Solobacterium sp.]
MNKNELIMESEIGNIRIVSNEGKICEISYCEAKLKESNEGILLEAKKQLEEYFRGKRKRFSLPIKIEGTDFQLAVWKATMDIPYGEICTYQDLALRIGKGNAQRAVGMALNRNPIAIVIPCHRIVGKNKKLIGYAGGVDKKAYLLEVEGVFGEEVL